MTKLTSETPINSLDLLKSVFKPDDYDFSEDEDEIKIVDKSNEMNSLTLNNNDLKDEIDAVKVYGDFFTIGEGFLNFILFDQRQAFSGEKIIIDGAFKGKIERKYPALALLITNINNIISMDKFKQNKSVIFEELLKDNIMVCELEIKKEFLDISSLNTNEISKKVDQIINSVLANISNTGNLLLTNPRNLLSKTNSNVLSVSDGDTINVGYIKDPEPILYFLAAEEMDYPHLRYLEYYHILEYYFNHKRVKQIDNLIRKLIATKLANGGKLTNSDSYFHDLNQLINKHQFDKDSNKEINQLTEIIVEDLGYNLLSSNFNSSSEEYEFLKKPLFNLKETIMTSYSNVYNRSTKKLKNDVKNEEGIEFCKDLAKRIYKIRNHIVHTKKYEYDVVFYPSQVNYTELEKDLALIRLISMLLINSYE
ncbi:hypothetical protein M1D47_21155 [Bacillus sp. R1-10]